MQIEIEDLVYSNTWSILVRPKNASIIKGRQVLNKKYNLDNTIKRYKARQVAKGFLQKYNINYRETFASTSKPSLIRLLLSIFAYLDQEIYTWDIKQAFPYAEIDIENICMQFCLQAQKSLYLRNSQKTVKTKIFQKQLKLLLDIKIILEQYAN